MKTAPVNSVAKASAVKQVNPTADMVKFKELAAKEGAKKAEGWQSASKALGWVSTGAKALGFSNVALCTTLAAGAANSAGELERGNELGAAIGFAGCGLAVAVSAYNASGTGDGITAAQGEADCRAALTEPTIVSDPNAVFEPVAPKYDVNPAVRDVSIPPQVEAPLVEAPSVEIA